MLFLVATPIGHLDDFSKRAIDSLNASDLILCEDTRRSRHLLERYDINKPLLSYHKFKEKQALKNIVDQLQNGHVISLISDAGTPCINDPGYLLVTACIERQIPFTHIPGACSIIQALLLSGCDPSRFQWIGFLPKKPKAVLMQALCYPGTTICFESPERLVATLKLLPEERKVAVAREMTKIFEECVRGCAKEVLDHFLKKKPKGEIVLVIAEGPIPDQIDVETCIQILQTLHGLSLKEAIKLAAKLKGERKKEVYSRFCKPLVNEEKDH